jgi:hypothetical protein
MNKIVFFTSILITFATSVANAQFWMTQTAADNRYMSSDISSAFDTGESIALGGDESFTIAGWVNLKDFSCTGFLFGTSSVEVEVLDSDDDDFLRKKVRFTIKDSISIEGSTFIEAISSLLEPSGLNIHITVTYSGSGLASGMKIYINGDQLSISNVVNNAISGAIPVQNITIGNNSCSLHYYEVSGYNSDLSHDQIRTLSKSLLNSLSPSFTVSGTEQNRPTGFFSQMFRNFQMGNDVARTCRLGVWGGRKGFDTFSSFGSPIDGSFYRGQAYYNPIDGKTYIATQSRPGPGYSRDAYVGVFDHEKRVLTITNNCKAETDLTRDNHQAPVIITTLDSSILVFNEDQHNSPMYVYKFSNDQKGEVESTTSIGSNTAYAQAFYLGSDLFMICRNGNDYEKRLIYKSTDDGDTWDAGTIFSQVQSSQWNYGTTAVFEDSILYHIGQIRTGGGISPFRYTYTLQTNDGVNFCNMDSTYCKDVSVSAWDYSEIIEYALLDSAIASDQSVGFFDALVDTANRLHIIMSSPELGLLQRGMYDNGVLSIDTLSFLDSISTDRARGSNTTVMVYKGGYSFDLFQARDTLGSEHVIKYTTTDNFQTFGSGQIVSEGSIDFGAATTTRIQIADRRVLVVFTKLENSDTGETSLWIYEYNPWE